MASIIYDRQWKKIRSVIYFNANAHHKQVQYPNHDHIHKIRPVVVHLSKLFVRAALFDQRLSLDEQMYSTKGAHFKEQYLPNKHHKWCFKLFVLCSFFGYAYSFEIYSGKQVVDYLSDEPNVRVVGNTVII
ncbi:DDE_Tnp_1_7 domain-containing protein [Trichonephila clavata]|uniref:DDE_Tnp_1_7 domain-containing protein n=1 Tax=Trichonephila clavata TaxID=2740835 RepID=A0A8X6HQC9_TRICU|nr:DDE_Tnp_1_7 domain-containing protein [Trichonephila clavata]